MRLRGASRRAPLYFREISVKYGRSGAPKKRKTVRGGKRKKKLPARPQPAGSDDDEAGALRRWELAALFSSPKVGSR